MKISNVEIFDLNTKLGSVWHPVVIRINTDEGISGVGEVALPHHVGHMAGAAMVRNMAENYLIGTNPFQIEQIWEKLFRTTFWGFGGGPVYYGGISAIDIALWDIKAKSLGVPVYELLGGKTNDNLPTYASQIQRNWRHDNTMENLRKPEEYAEECLRALEDGYRCIKLDPVVNAPEGMQWNLINIPTNDIYREVYNRIKAVREAVGVDVEIILDLHSLLSPAASKKLAPIWEEFNCYYCEEPVNYMNVDLQDAATKGAKIPMAAGERLYTRWGFRQYFEKQTLDVIQPDLGLCGGITEGKKICDYARIYDITVQCHCCGSPVMTAASLHLEATIPNLILHEHFTYAIKPANIEICKQNYQPVNGRYAVPDLPGLGIELNDEVVYQSPHVKVS